MVGISSTGRDGLLEASRVNYSKFVWRSHHPFRYQTPRPVAQGDICPVCPKFIQYRLAN